MKLSKVFQDKTYAVLRFFFTWVWDVSKLKYIPWSALNKQGITQNGEE